MIIQTGMRTDIPAFYADWFANRLNEGFVLVRNPYNPSAVTRYELDPSVVDMIGFCSKNPAPMLKYMDLLKPYGQYWFVTITPYGNDIGIEGQYKEMVSFFEAEDLGIKKVYGDGNKAETTLADMEAFGASIK